MMNNTYQLIYRGEVLEGFALDIVKQNLGQLLKIDDLQLGSLFSGKSTVLKRGLSVQEGQRYQTHLENLGAKVYLESAVPSPLAVATADSGVPPNSPPAPDVETVICPKCGEEQPKRTLCRACVVDMPRFRAAKEAEEAEAKAQRLAEYQAKRSGGAKEAGSTLNSFEHGEAPSIFGLSIEGRMGRISYGTAIAFLTSFIVWILLGAIKFNSNALVILALVVMALYAIRLSIVRLHDVNLHGAWTFLAGVPYVGELASILLTFWPGTQGDNNYGPKPKTGGTMLALISGVVLILSLVGAVRPLWKAAEQRYMQQMRDEMSDDDEELAPGAYSSNNRVLIYDVNCTSSCQRLTSGLQAMGINPTYIQVPAEGDELNALATRMQDAGVDVSRFSSPIVEVNGTFLPNNPPLDRVAQHLRR